MIKKPGVLSRTRFTTANLVLEVERSFTTCKIDGDQVMFVSDRLDY
jgi:hypothetical protein